MTPEELVVQAMRRLGIDPDSKTANRELGVKLRLNPSDASQARQTVARWRGKSGPSFDATLLLLKTAGWLSEEQMDGVVLHLPSAAEDQELAARLDRIERMQEQVLEMLVSRADQDGLAVPRARKGRA